MSFHEAFCWVRLPPFLLLVGLHWHLHPTTLAAPVDLGCLFSKPMHVTMPQNSYVFVSVFSTCTMHREKGGLINATICLKFHISFAPVMNFPSSLVMSFVVAPFRPNHPNWQVAMINSCTKVLV